MGFDMDLNGDLMGFHGIGLEFHGIGDL